MNLAKQFDDIQPSCACGQKATYIAEKHLLGWCNHPASTPSGGVIKLVCKPCLDTIATTITKELKQAQRRAPTVNWSCRTCGRPINNINDIIRVEVI